MVVLKSSILFVASIIALPTIQSTQTPSTPSADYLEQLDSPGPAADRYGRSVIVPRACPKHLQDLWSVNTKFDAIVDAIVEHKDSTSQPHLTTTFQKAAKINQVFNVRIKKAPRSPMSEQTRNGWWSLLRLANEALLITATVLK